MARSRVRLSSEGMRQLLQDRGVVQDLERRGRSVLASAVASAAVESGAYRDGLTVWTAQTDRPVVRVGSTVDYGPAVEARTGNLARALDAAGGA